MARSILVKAAMPSLSGALSIGGRNVAFKARPIMPSVGAAGGPTRGFAPTSVQWHAVDLNRADINLWDACHAATSVGLGFASGASVEFAEPDFEQTWNWGPDVHGALAFRGECGPPKPQNLRPYEGVDGDDLWFLDAAHSGLAAARATVGVPPADRRIRIAHLDTGYDPNHSSLPSYLRLDLQKNFVEDDSSAEDRRAGLAQPNIGHGTGTLALLAGKPVPFDGEPVTIGGAANLEVVPLRVANGVVLFRTSAVAQAFDYVHKLWERPEDRCHIVTMSMGGLASAAWADAVNALYERGIFVVTAAGNNFNDLPTRFIVYPARFRRVLAACGVMAGGSPYTDLPGFVMQGCYGPDRKMQTAMSAFTPNVPWARLGCADLFDRHGGGTSSATPQIAAAAALWMQRHIDALEAMEGWRRVELTRAALMRSASNPTGNVKKLGAGALKAAAALKLSPSDLGDVTMQKKDSARFALLRGLLGLGAADSAGERMLELEALQLTQQSREVEREVENADIDPDDETVSRRDAQRVLDALAADARTSKALRSFILSAPGRPSPKSLKGIPSQIEPLTEISSEATALASSAVASEPTIASPTTRNLRVYAFDPSLASNFEYFHLNETVLRVRWEEKLAPGPVGEYLEVVDVDPPSGAAYAPVNLNQPSVLAQQGHAPSEGDPQFHQQMVYAVSMRTIDIFEQALGRRALWSEHWDPTADPKSRFVRRLRIYPHALREANAYYSPPRKALLFGYFNAADADTADVLPGGLVFTCLSHDIVAHETAHALLDGLHPRFGKATNPDVLAFHEGFSDIVALFQHFMIPDALEFEIARTRGDLRIADLLGGLAVEFGQAIQNRKALRSAIATRNEKGEWERVQPTKLDYEKHQQPHARGALLVAAIFDAFLKIYDREARQLIRLASGGSGVLPPGEISPNLVEALALCASKSAARVLNVCIRALDYCPPVDLTFGEFLRAIISADRELVPNDERGYRVAFITAFRDRGIYPPDVVNISPHTLAWHPPSRSLKELEEALADLAVTWNLKSDRLDAYLSSNNAARKLSIALASPQMPKSILEELGIVKSSRRTAVTIDGQEGFVSPIEVHSVRPAVRVSPLGAVLREVIVELTQKFTTNGESYLGGCTLIFDPEESRIKFAIRKRVGHKKRMAAELGYSESLTFMSPAGGYFSGGGRHGEPFAFVHGL